MSGASFARRHLSRISTRDYIAVAVTALYFLGQPGLLRFMGVQQR